MQLRRLLYGLVAGCGLHRRSCAAITSSATMAARATKEVGFLTGAKWFRLCCEQEPVVVVSAIMGGIGLLMPCILGDGGRAAEEASSNYAYRIRKQYPAESGA